jgi:hypothetical protein
MPHITYLSLGYNALETLCDDIFVDNTHLTTLLLDHNRLKAVPKSVLGLSKLTGSDLSLSLTLIFSLSLSLSLSLSPFLPPYLRVAFLFSSFSVF